MASEEAQSAQPGVISFLQCHIMTNPRVVKLSNVELHPDYQAMRLQHQLPFVVKIYI